MEDMPQVTVSPMPVTTPKKKGPWLAIALAVLGLAVGIALGWILRGSEVADLNDANVILKGEAEDAMSQVARMKADEDAAMMEEVPLGAYSEPVLTDRVHFADLGRDVRTPFVLVRPDGGTVTIDPSVSENELHGQFIGAGITDPTDPDIVYFTTYGESVGASVEYRVYAYRVSSGEIERLYDMVGGVALHLLGMQGSRLIFWQTGFDNSPGPCFTAWAGEDLIALELSDSSAGLEPYGPPRYVVDKMVEESEACALRMQG